MKIVFTGGGTGGHIFPIVAVAKKLREIAPPGEDMDFMFLGSDGTIEREAMGKELIPAKKILSGKMRRYFSLNYISDIFKFPIGIFQALWHLLVFMPDAVFSKGGYAGVPVVLAAWIYRIPVVIHESDVTPGLANQLASRFARVVAVSFPAASNFFNPGKVVITGNPIREELTKGDLETAKKIFGLSDNKKTILVIGGSQGAQTINNAILQILPRLVKKYQIIQITGVGEYDRVVTEAGKIGIKAGHGEYFPFPFLKDEIADAFAVADLVISRAGANSLTEIAANGKPAIVIPIKYSANDHQQLNAYAFGETGAAVVIDQDNLGENIFLEKIEELMASSDLQYELKERVKKFYNPESSKIIAEEILKVAS